MPMHMDEDRPDEDRPGVNTLAAPLVAELVRQAAILRLRTERQEGGALIVDAGIACRGGLEAGRRIAEICLGGLGTVELGTIPHLPRWPAGIAVRTTDPVLACLGSQYAGWSLSHGEGPDAFFALGSGPGRALAGKETLFEELGYRDKADSTVLVLESDRPPPPELSRSIAEACGIAPDRLTLILTPTRSLAGTVQVVGRVLEVALHKVHTLGFPLDRVIDGWGAAPLPPPGPDFLSAMGRTNDAILYGGVVQLFVSGPDDAAADLAQRLPSAASRDHGKPFAEIFGAVKGDFYAIDPLLFSPAQVIVSALESGRSFRGGAVDPALIDRSFDGAADAP